MTITISNLEFLQYHEKIYTIDSKYDYVRQYIQSKSGDFYIRDNTEKALELAKGSPERNDETFSKQSGLELSNLIIDADTLEQNTACNEDYIDDENVRDYVESQKLHRLQFLKEIHEKGLRTSHTDTGRNDKKFLLNY